MPKPTAHLIHGYLGAGKTTFAKRLAAELGAVRYSPDELMVARHGHDPPDRSLALGCVWYGRGEMRTLISSGSSFEKAVGYSRAVVDGEWVFVSGTTGFDYETMTISDDPVAQTRQALANVARALAQAGASLADVVRVNYIVPRADDWQHIAPVLGEHFGAIRPASTAIVAGLVDARMRVEIEVTARRSREPLEAKVSRAVTTNAFNPEPGLKRHILANNPELMLVEHHMEKGWEGTRHSHPHHQLVYIVSGHLRVDCGGRTFEVQAGDSFIVDGGVEHQAWAIAPSVVLDVFTPTRKDYLP